MQASYSCPFGAFEGRGCPVGNILTIPRATGIEIEGDSIVQIQGWDYAEHNKTHNASSYVQITGDFEAVIKVSTLVLLSHAFFVL